MLIVLFYRPFQISIHALREESDAMLEGTAVLWEEFQSTPSARRATHFDALLANVAKFQSTPSARRATQKLRRDSSKRIFQSTPSARRATAALNKE